MRTAAAMHPAVCQTRGTAWQSSGVNGGLLIGRWACSGNGAAGSGAFAAGCAEATPSGSARLAQHSSDAHTRHIILAADNSAVRPTLEGGGWRQRASRQRRSLLPHTDRICTYNQAAWGKLLSGPAPHLLSTPAERHVPRVKRLQSAGIRMCSLRSRGARAKWGARCVHLHFARTRSSEVICAGRRPRSQI